MAPRASNLHGLLVVDKPGLPPDAQPPPVDAPSAQRLPTSHDIVQQVRRWSGERRIGHTGTLDPMASGVLVLCLGHATRLVEYYQGHDKRYDAEVTLGIATDTYDALGQTTAVAPIPTLNRTNVETALHQFLGSVLQSPPIYSAIKQGGESVHRKARRGEDVVLTPRPVKFYELELLAIQEPDRLALRVRCSAGAYVRSLAYDLGKALGTVGHLSALRRKAAGSLTLENAHGLAAIEAAAQQGAIERLLLPPGYGLTLPRFTVTADTARRLGFGQHVLLNEPMLHVAHTDDGIAQALDEDGLLIGIVRCLSWQENGGVVVKADKWFAQEQQ